MDLGVDILDVAVGAKGEETTLVKDGITTIVYEEFDNEMACAQCIRAGYSFVYNYNVYEREDVEIEYDDDGNEVEVEIDEATLPSYYQDLADDDTNYGWCCEMAGTKGMVCGTRTIDSETVELVPDDTTPSSMDFGSDDLAVVACPQLTSNCGDRNVTMETIDDTVTLSATGLTNSDSCSYIVKVSCGIPIFSVSSQPSSITDDNAKLTYVEYQSDTVDDFDTDEFAPPSETVIPQNFFNWD